MFSRRLSLLGLLLLGACAAPDPSHVHVSVMGTQAYGDAMTVTARSGDTVYQIAQNMGVDTRALIDRNNLSPPYALTAGQVLRIPSPQMIRTHAGDTLFSVARAYGADQSEIVKLNNLQPPYIFGDQQEIKLPTTATSKNGVTMITEDAAPIDNTPVVTENLSGPIATSTDANGNKIHTSAAGIIKEQDMAPPSGAVQAKPEQKLGETKVASVAKPAEAPKAKPSLGTGTPSFSWPVNGSTLSDYGAKAGGRHNDGINIGAPLGTPVRTAAPGEIVYTGDNVAGFGNLILIRHSGGYATAYAHLQKVLVKQGDHVSSGQAIAQIGKTGNVSSPQLHFEIRKGTQAINPKPFLP